MIDNIESNHNDNANIINNTMWDTTAVYQADNLFRQLHLVCLLLLYVYII
jgi:hypothetical protein